MSQETKQIAENADEFNVLRTADVKAAFAVIANNSKEDHIRVFALAMFNRLKLNAPEVNPMESALRRIAELPLGHHDAKKIGQDALKVADYKRCPACKTEWTGEIDKCPECGDAQYNRDRARKLEEQIALEGNRFTPLTEGFGDKP